MRRGQIPGTPSPPADRGRRPFSGQTGYAALGVMVPPERLACALRHLRDMVPDVDTGHALATLGRTSGYIERDMPYEALGALMESDTVDLTGCYRLLAVLLTDPEY